MRIFEKGIFWVFILFIYLSTNIYGQFTDINDVAEVLLASEAQMPDIKIKYTYTSYNTNNPETNKQIISGLYACKKAEGLIMVDSSLTIFNETGDIKRFQDGCVSFNGKATFWLNREKRTADIMMASISSGYIQNMVENNTHDNPDWLIWKLNSLYSFSDLLKGNSANLKITGEETINALKTVKIEGNVFENAGYLSLWICPDRDFLPIKLQLTSKKNGGAVIRELRDLFQLENGRWYPRKIIIGPEKYGWCMTVDEIDTQTIPNEYFTLKFPPNTHVTDHILGATYMIDSTIPGYDVDSDVLSLPNKEYSSSAEKAIDNYLKNNTCPPKEALDTNMSQEIQTTLDDAPYNENIEAAEIISEHNGYLYKIAIPILIVLGVLTAILINKGRRSR